MPTFSLVGPGRAGSAMARALSAIGWDAGETFGRTDDPAPAATGVELVLIATPDGEIADIARRIHPSDTAVVVHVSGATPIAVLGRHPRHGGLHPLASMSGNITDANALRTCWYGVAGDPITEELAAHLSGRHLRIEDEQRPLYHAAAAVASNHTTAVLGQAERLAAEIGLPFEALAPLVRATVESTFAHGAAAALTGPASRGDEETIAGHRRAIARHAPDELAGYDAGVELARYLAASRDGRAD